MDRHDAVVSVTTTHEPPRRHRNIRARRWRVAIASVRFATRLRRAPRAGLTASETNAALELYMAHTNEVGSIDNRTQLQAILLAAGQLVDEEQVLDLCQRCGYEEGTALQFDQFSSMLSVRKRAYHEAQDITDTEAAFRSLMDPETEDISTGRLLALCKDFCLSSEVEQLIEETDADGSGKIELDEFTELLQPAEAGNDPLNHDDELSGDEAAELAVTRATAHRRVLKADETKVYEAFKNRVGGGLQLFASLRGRLESSAGAGIRSMNVSAAAPPRALRPAVTAGASTSTRSPPRNQDREQLPSVRRPLSPPNRSTHPIRPSTEGGDACRRFGNFVIVQHYQRFEGPNGNILPSRVPVPPPSVRRRYFKPKRPETLNGSAERLTPRPTVDPSTIRVPVSQASAFGSSSGRFEHTVIASLPPPSLSPRKLTNREHPSDHCSIYRRGRSPRVSTTAVSPRSSCHERSLSPTKALPSSSAAERPAPQPVPDYAVFNPFLGLPPPKASTSRPKEAGDAGLPPIHSPGRPPRGNSNNTIAASSTNRYSAANVQLVLQTAEGSNSSRPSSSHSSNARH